MALDHACLKTFKQFRTLPNPYGWCFPRVHDAEGLVPEWGCPGPRQPFARGAASAAWNTDWLGENH